MRNESLLQGLRAALAYQFSRTVADQYPTGMYPRDAVAARGLVHEMGRDENRLFARA